MFCCYVEYNVLLLVLTTVLAARNEHGQLMLKTAVIMSSDLRYAMSMMVFECVLK